MTNMTTTDGAEIFFKGWGALQPLAAATGAVRS